MLDNVVFPNLPSSLIVLIHSNDNIYCQARDDAIPGHCSRQLIHPKKDHVIVLWAHIKSLLDNEK